MDEVVRVLDRRLRKGAAAPLIVALSGGGDSLALLLAAKAWSQSARRTLIAVTIDHCLQPDTASWALWCAARAERLGIAHRTLAWTGDKPTAGIQARARSARHERLATAAREAGATVVLMGHTLDDLLEARAMRAAGGSVGEPREWSPSPVWPLGRGVFLLRPLLGLRRRALRDHLRGLGETWIDDPANADPASARARARLILGGFAEAADFPPALPPAPASNRRRGNFAEGTPAKPVKETSRRDLLSRTVSGAAGDLTLDLAGASPDERRLLLGGALVCAGGGERPPRRAALDRLLAQVGQTHEGVATLAGARARYRGDHIHLAREAAIMRREPCERVLSLELPIVWDGRFEIVARAPGFAVRPLAGLAARLDRTAREALRLVPAASRGGLPAFVAPSGSVLCPSVQSEPEVCVQALVSNRLASALGVIEDEAAAETWRREAERTKSARREEGQSVQ